MEKRRLEREEEGVAEVVGSILTLVITVTLFTSIFIAVQSIEAPSAENKPEFQGKFEVGGEPPVLYFNVTHLGGRSLRSRDTSVLLSGDVSLSFKLDQEELRDGHSSIGETLNLEVTSEDEGYHELLSSEEIELMIRDDVSRRIIWTSMLKRRDLNPPYIHDHGVIYSTSWGRYAEPGERVTFWADVIDVDTPSAEDIEVTLNLENIMDDKRVMELHGRFKAYEVNRYKLETDLDDTLSQGTYRLELLATDGINAEDISYYIVLHVGSVPFTEYPWIQVRQLSFRPLSLTSMDDLYVTASVINRGGSSVDAQIDFYDKHPDGVNHHMATRTISLPAGGGIDVTAGWQVKGSGQHEIGVEVTVPVGIGDELFEKLSVAPRTLLVDAYSVPGETSLEVRKMQNALASVDIPYELTMNTATSEQLSDFDVAIWMTGSKRENTLTQEEREVIAEFLERGKRLWLIGEGIVSDASENHWSLWLEEQLHSRITDQDLAPRDVLIGYGEPLTWEDEFQIVDDPELRRGHYIEPVNGGISMLRDTGNDHKTIAVSYNGSDMGKRSVFQPFLFSALTESDAGRTRLTYDIILWLGDINERSGDDLALTYQAIYPKAPDYKETVTISAVVRNNGPTSFERVNVALDMNGVVQEIKLIEIEGKGGTATVTFTWIAEEVDAFEMRVIVDPFDEIKETNPFNNDAGYLGIDITVNVQYTVLIVDDGMEEKEASLSGKEVKQAYQRLGYVDHYFITGPDSWPDAELMGNYNTVVWTTGEKEEPLRNEHKRENITNYLEEYPATLLIMGDGLVREDYTDHRDFLEDVLKIRPDTSEVPTPEFIKGTTNDVVTHGMEYFLSGDKERYAYTPLSDSRTIFSHGDDVFAHRYHDILGDHKIVVLAIDHVHFERPFPEDEMHWYEEYDFNVSSSSMREEFIFMTTRWFGKEDMRVELRISRQDIYIEDDPMLGRTYAIRADIENVGGTDSGAMVQFKDGDSHIDTESLFVPAGGKSSAEVKWEPINAGPARPIRVIVDPDHIVPEIPNLPGERGPVKDHMGFNNQMIVYRPVYFFYDDMESGPDKWTHGTQLALISGESPLDYLGEGYTQVDSAVVHEWEEMKGTIMVDWDSYSDPYSYFMQEPVGKISVDVLVVLAIDSSGSMENREVYCQEEGSYVTWLDMAKRASKVLVNRLSNNSAVGIWDFGGTNPREVLSPPVRLEGDGREIVLDVVDEISATPQTPLWDTVGYAYRDAATYHQELFPDLIPNVVVLSDGADNHAADIAESHMAEKGSREWAPWHSMEIPNVVVLSDGADNHAADIAESHMAEKGSREWAPWHSMESASGYPEIYYPDHYGKYRLPYHAYEGPYEPGEWSRVSDSPGGWVQTRKGLLHSPIPIYTIGLGLENNPDVLENPEDPDWNPAKDFESAGPGNYTIERDENNRATWEAGTTEYNLWRIASTSGGDYFYSPDAEELEDIFETIAFRLARPANLSSIQDHRISSSRYTGSTSFFEHPSFPYSSEDNFDKYAVTPSFDLTEMSSASLTFWHRYQIIQGRNGAFIEIGYHDEDLQHYVWEQAHPVVGPYTGNLLYEEGDEIVWAWNGKSAQGTMGWDHVRLNIVNHLDRSEVPNEWRDRVRVRFYYKQFGGSNRPGGWLIDDVGITATRKGDSSHNIDENMMDTWQLTDTASKSGTHSWWNADQEAHLPRGVDNRLTTVTIDLTNAKRAVLSAHFRFNINEKSGAPPNGFRIEVTTDDGRTWECINQGVRAASGYSLEHPYADANGWVEAKDLQRLNTDLSGFRGETIKLSFRVVTNDLQEPYEDPDGFGGLYIDDVIIYGETN